MSQEEKQLLFKDLCARIPYDPFIALGESKVPIRLGYIVDLYPHEDSKFIAVRMYNAKPYLRPISSISNAEVDKLFNILNINEENETEWLKVNNINVIRLFTQEGKDFYEIAKAMDYLYSIHIDFRGLIERDLAIEAPVDMYK